MHVGFVAHNFVRGNGQGRINCEIARFAARNGERVTLLADRVDEDLLNEPGISWVPIQRRPRRPNLICAWRVAAAADAALRRMRADFDVVVGAGYTLSEPHDVNLCQFVHGAWLRSPVHIARLSRGPWAWYQWAYTRCNVKWELATYSAAATVVAPSEKIRAELLSIGLPSRKVKVIYNGVDLNEFRPREHAAACAAKRSSLSLPVEGTIALFVGDIRTRRKNLDSVLRALQLTGGLRLVVVGALRGSSFPQMARELGVANRVTFTDFRRDVNEVMQAADFFVFPSRYEAGTLVLIEAMSSGLPVVTARSAGGCEIINESAGIILEDPDDVPALASAMAHWADNPEARRAASVAARSIAEQYSWERMAEAYLDLFAAAARLSSASAIAAH